jgi:hypothetical protein
MAITPQEWTYRTNLHKTAALFYEATEALDECDGRMRLHGCDAVDKQHPGCADLIAERSNLTVALSIVIENHEQAKKDFEVYKASNTQHFVPKR